MLQSLFVRCAARLGGDEPETYPTGSRVSLDAYVEAAPSHRMRMVEEHLAAMPDEYLEL